MNDRLMKLLTLALSSDNDGESSNALASAKRMMKSENLSAHDVIGGSVRTETVVKTVYADKKSFDQRFTFSIGKRLTSNAGQTLFNVIDFLAHERVRDEIQIVETRVDDTYVHMTFESTPYAYELFQQIMDIRPGETKHRKSQKQRQEQSQKKDDPTKKWREEVRQAKERAEEAKKKEKSTLGKIWDFFT